MRFLTSGILIILFIIFFVSCSTNRIMLETDFANELALRGLWKEALLRWQKILKQGSDSAMLHNNMAIAYEWMGKLKKAEMEYKIALKMAPDNKRIKSNLDNLKKLMKRVENEK